MGIRLKITRQLLALARKFEREILMLGFRERKAFLLLVFDEGRKMWNEDNKEGNLVMLEIKMD